MGDRNLIKTLSGHFVMDIASSISDPGVFRIRSQTALQEPFTLPGGQVNQAKDLESIHTRWNSTIEEVLVELTTHMPQLKVWGTQRKLDTTKVEEIAFADFEPYEEYSRIGNMSTSKGYQMMEITDGDRIVDLVDWYSKLIVNPRDRCVTLSFHNSPFSILMPPKSSFILGSFRYSVPLVSKILDKDHSSFDFILLDPPWPNRSVSRNSKYNTMDIHELYKLDMRRWLCEDGIVAIWCTNKSKYRHFVMNRLAKVWGLEYLTEWLWLKVTTNGEPIFDLASNNRKPYEELIFLRKRNKKQKRDNRIMLEKRIIVAVPDLHSRKPQLTGTMMSIRALLMWEVL